MYNFHIISIASDDNDQTPGAININDILDRDFCYSDFNDGFTP